MIYPLLGLAWTKPNDDGKHKKLKGMWKVDVFLSNKEFLGTIAARTEGATN